MDISRTVDFRDVPAALGLLTRLPFRVDADWAMARGARSAWAYPLAGALLGIGAIALASLGTSVGIPPTMTALLILSAWVFCIGALHEDGLADTFDGLWGGWERDRRLDIMKDSRIGTYGVIALALSLAVRWQGLTLAVEANAFWTLIAIPTVSRAAMVALMRMPHARPEGLSAKVGHPPVSNIYIAVGIGIAALLPLIWVGFWVATGIAAMAWILSRVANAKIGGQTGDILGAAQQLAEATAWIIIAAAVTNL